MLFDVYTHGNPRIIVKNMQLATQIRNQSLIEQFYNIWKKFVQNYKIENKNRFWNGEWEVFIAHNFIDIQFSTHGAIYASINTLIN